MFRKQLIADFPAVLELDSGSQDAGQGAGFDHAAIVNHWLLITCSSIALYFIVISVFIFQ